MHRNNHLGLIPEKELKPEQCSKYCKKCKKITPGIFKCDKCKTKK